MYSLKCIRCCRSIIAPGSIGETLYHTPIAMLHHWGMIVTKDATVDPPGEFNIASIPLVCTSLDSYYQALKSSLGTHTNKEFCSPKQNLCHHQLSFCEAVKADMSKKNDSHNNPKTKDSKYKDAVAHTLSLVRVLFGDFGVAISKHGNANDIHNIHPISPLILFNDGFKFEKGIIADKEYN
jgi:hypothetical protein